MENSQKRRILHNKCARCSTYFKPGELVISVTGPYCPVSIPCHDVCLQEKDQVVSDRLCKRDTSNLKDSPILCNGPAISGGFYVRFGRDLEEEWHVAIFNGLPEVMMQSNMLNIVNYRTPGFTIPREDVMVKTDWQILKDLGIQYSPDKSIYRQMFS